MEHNAGAGMGHSDTVAATFGIGAGICGAACGEVGSAIPASFAQARANTGTKGNAKQRNAGSKSVAGIRCRGRAGCAEGLQNSAGTSVVGGRRSGFKMDAHMGGSIIAATWQRTGLSICARESVAAGRVNEGTSLHGLRRLHDESGEAELGVALWTFGNI